MTTIAYRDGVIAGDTQVTWSDTRDSSVTKIRRFGPLLAGAAGDISMARRFMDWLARGAPNRPPSPIGPDYRLNAFIVMPDDLIVQFNGETSWYSRARYFAVGSGAKIAIGAMEFGASAVEAVRCAARVDLSTGGEIQFERRRGA